MTSTFDDFWRAYPRRVAKGAARKAFDKAIKKTDIETILKAVEAYKVCKPDYQDWAHPSTWLNQERWEDEWDMPDNAVDEEILRQAREADEEEQDGLFKRDSSHLRLV